MKTALGHPDLPPEIRRGRMQAIADSLVLPFGVARQALARSTRLGNRKNS